MEKVSCPSVEEALAEGALAPSPATSFHIATCTLPTWLVSRPVLVPSLRVALQENSTVAVIESEATTKLGCYRG